MDILVVEDNPTDFFLFSEYLKLAHVPTNRIYHAEKLNEALQILQSNNPDLIFLDLTLPDSEGVDSFSTINSMASHISIVVLSGLADTQIALKTIALGAQDYLVKGDFDEKLLLRTIRYSIERKKILQKVIENSERYNTLIKATNDTIWDWDLRANKVYWNDGITNIFGFPPSKVRDTIEWRHEHIHPCDRDRVVQRIADCIPNGISQWQDEYQYRCANGEYKFVYDRGYILRTEQNRPYRMIGAMIDITERKKFQEELIRNQIEQQKLITQITIQTQEKERSDIGRELHDNINQILATAKLYVDMAINEEDIREELLYKSHDKISKAISEIRLLSKSLVPPSLGDIGLKEALLEMIENLNVSPGLKIHVKANDFRIENLSDTKKLIIYRIVQEQINNIQKHSRATEAEIKVYTNGNTLHMTIRDNGIGFDLQKKNRGIGLNNIASRVEMQTGRMRIVAAPGKGCMIDIEMPV